MENYTGEHSQVILDVRSTSKFYQHYIVGRCRHRRCSEFGFLKCVHQCYRFVKCPQFAGLSKYLMARE